MHSELPPFVHKKTAKGLTYYYFALDAGATGRPPRYLRLPDITDPLFQGKLAELYRVRAPNPNQRRARSIRRRLACQVYFVGNDEGPIKIGSSRDPEGRCRDMRIGSPVDFRVLATTPGGVPLEKAYHRRFGYARLRGEWFERAPELMAEIERLNWQEQNGDLQTTENRGAKC